MFRTISALTLAFASLCSAAVAAEEIGYGRFFVNDFLGDGHDRWRSGAVMGSHIYGEEWTGALPIGFGEIVELRVMGQVIAPNNLESTTGGDRPYATALSIGAHTHFQRGFAEYAVGGDMVLVGEHNGISEVQGILHDIAGMARPSDVVIDAQIGNQLVPTFVFEMGAPVFDGPSFALRPFLEARAGDETLMRAGVDLRIGGATQNDLMVREPVTGHRMRTMRSYTDDWSIVLGADIARVEDSIYLSTADMEETRSRVRAGVHLQRETYRIFYGVSWLSEEFKTQSEPQLLGAVRLQLDF